jgi:aminoglycoside phosphotransferase family enzyme/predicted kinase
MMSTIPLWLPALTEALQKQCPNQPLEKIETHISIVLLVGDRAIKIKKAQDFGFLDFSTLEKRQQYCQAEYSLNRRLAATLYQSLGAIVGTPESPRFCENIAENQTENIIEPCIVMRRFPQERLLDNLLQIDALSVAMIESIGEKIALFHRDAEKVAADAPWGQPAAVIAPMRENFQQIAPFLTDHPLLQPRLTQLADWTEARFAALTPLLQARRAAGFIRAGHGDLHLGNMFAEADAQVQIFDGIEFNEGFRWIDTINDSAFLYMDLLKRGRPDYASAFLNAYLEVSGDYAALPLLRFYSVYRAMVRAKIALFSLAYDEVAWARFQEYLTLAEHLAFAPSNPRLLVMHAPSGSGKSLLSKRLVTEKSLLRLRADAERQRLFHGEGRYNATASEATYARLADFATVALANGFSVIIDATCLKRWQRVLFLALAKRLAVSIYFVSIQCDKETLHGFITQRQAEGQDISEADTAVLEQQLATQEPLTPEEAALAVTVDCRTLILPEDFMLN